MENNATTGMSTLVERFGASRRDKSHKDKDHKDKDHRLSKADIGGPISTTAEKTDGSDSQFDGAAYKAGVRQGDRIVNVNGTRVTEYNHIEVVKLIKSGAFVNLTLLGKPLPTDTSSTSQTATGSMSVTTVSQPAASKEDTFFNEKVATIKKMLKQEAAEVERIKEEYAKQPNSRLLNQLRVAQKLKQDLEKQLWKAESIHQNQLDMVQVPAGSHDITPIETTNTGDLEGITVYDSEEIPEQEMGQGVL